MLEAIQERARQKLMAKLPPFLGPQEKAVEAVRVTRIPIFAPLTVAVSVSAVAVFSLLMSTGRDASHPVWILALGMTSGFWFPVSRPRVLVATDQRIFLVRLTLGGRLLGVERSASRGLVTMSVGERPSLSMFTSVQVGWPGQSAHRLFPIAGRWAIEQLDRMAAAAGVPPTPPAP